MSPSDPDPRRVIAEAYRIKAIGASECRSIFLDWALGAPDDGCGRARIEALLLRHEHAAPDHPMTRVLRDALAAPAPARRRGGALGRRRRGIG